VRAGEENAGAGRLDNSLDSQFPMMTYRSILIEHGKRNERKKRKNSGQKKTNEKKNMGAVFGSYNLFGRTSAKKRGTVVWRTSEREEGKSGRHRVLYPEMKI